MNLLIFFFTESFFFTLVSKDLTLLLYLKTLNGSSIQKVKSDLSILKDFVTSVDQAPTRP